MRDEVYGTLKHWIVGGVLEPGEKVRDLELAQRLGVSRMPVREALHRLAEEGFVQMAANRWTRVTPVDPTDAGRLYPIIWSLEHLAMLSAGPQLRERDLANMRRWNGRLRDALETSAPVEASRADAHFHQVFIEAAGNPELSKILAGAKAKLRRLEVAYFGGSVTASRSVDEHQAIIDAVERVDFRAAADAVRQNWQQSFERIFPITGNSGAPPCPE